MKLTDVMTKGAECISPEASLQEAARKMRDLDIGPLPVCKEDHLAGVITDQDIIGFITDRDIVVRGVCDGCDNITTKVRDLMTPGVEWCFEDDDLQEAAKKMQERQIRRLAVLNHDRELVGMVSLGDLAVHTPDGQLSGETLERVSEPSHSS